jgi:chemotaxis signal transduction protein
VVLIGEIGSQAANHLVVLVDGREYAIPMASVREVTPARLPTMVPGLPDYIRGFVSFEGRPTPVVDPSRFMNGWLLEVWARSCLVFIGGPRSESVAALLIDDIVGIADSGVVHRKQGGTKKSPLLASSFVVCGGRRVAVMQLQVLFEQDAHTGSAAPTSKGKSG